MAKTIAKSERLPPPNPGKAFAITSDERNLLLQLREASGGFFLRALSLESKDHLDRLLASLRAAVLIH